MIATAISVAEVGAVIVALVQAVKFAREKNYDSLLTIAIAGVFGIIAGLLGIAGLTAVTGFFLAMSAVGVITGASKIGGK